MAFLGYNDEKSFLHGRIVELTRQLDKSNEKLHDLQIVVGQLSAHNEILKKENEELRGARKGRRRREDDDNEEEASSIKRRRTSRKVEHSSEEEEERNEDARVRLKFPSNLLLFNFTEFLIKLTIILTDF